MRSHRFTAAVLKEFGAHSPDIMNMLKRRLAETYDEFLDILYDDIAIAIQKLEETPNLLFDQSEDAVTANLSNVLFGMGYAASHNKQLGGNVDLTVEVARMQFLWIAEAKWYDEIGDMRSGYQQLATRYRSQLDSNQVSHGGLIAYLRRPDAVKHMTKWKDEFSRMDEAPQASISACSRRGSLGFISEHPHVAFGTPFRVWHSCVVLYFKPEDPSGRKAIKYKKLSTT